MQEQASWKPVFRMTWGMVWRGGLLGMLAGLAMGCGVALCVAGYIAWGEVQSPDSHRLDPFAPLLLLTCLSAFLGSVVGALVGILTGGVGSLLLALITLFWFTPPRDIQSYRRTIRVLGFLIGVMPWLIVLIRSAPSVTDDTLFTLFLLGGAMVSGWIGSKATRIVIAWYGQESALFAAPEPPPAV